MNSSIYYTTIQFYTVLYFTILHVYDYILYTLQGDGCLTRFVCVLCWCDGQAKLACLSTSPGRLQSLSRVLAKSRKLPREGALTQTHNLASAACQDWGRRLSVLLAAGSAKTALASHRVDP